jgi:uncharacterized membrane protein YuzA (DUF378 family)
MKKGCCCPVCKIVGLVVVIGAINWGLVGAFNYNLVSSLLGFGSAGEKAVYIVVGVAGVMKLLSCFICCPLAKKCDAPVEEKGGCSTHKH